MKPEVIEQIVSALRRDPLYDFGQILKPGGRRMIREALSAQRADGRRAYVLTLPRALSPEAADAVWPALGADEARDLLLTFNGVAWRARGWGLTDEALTAALQRAGSARGHFGIKIVAALRALAGDPAPAQPTPAPTPEAPMTDSGAGLIMGLSLGGLALGGLAFALIRRQRLRHEGVAQAAIDEAEQRYAQLILDVEDLKDPELMARADPLRRDLDAATRNLRAATGADPVALGRLRTVTDHITALHSTVRQRRQGLN